MAGVPASSHGASTFNGGTITQPLIIDLTAAADNVTGLQLLLPATWDFSANGFSFHGGGLNLLRMGSEGDLRVGANGLALDGGAGTYVNTNGGALHVQAAGGAAQHQLDPVNGVGLYGSAAASRGTLHSGTATPEQIALALEASTLMTGD